MLKSLTLKDVFQKSLSCTVLIGLDYTVRDDLLVRGQA
jgi:hypothetical protein